MAALPAAPNNKGANKGSSKGSKGGSKGNAPRVSNPYNNALYQPGQLLSGKPLAQAAQAIANAQTNPTLAGYQSQIKANNSNTADVKRTDFGYYMQLAQAAKDAVANVQKSGQDLQGTLQGIGTNTQNDIAAEGQRLQGGPLGRMGAAGVAGDNLANLQAQTDQQAGLAKQTSGAAQTFGAQTSANNYANANTQMAATGMRGQEQLAALDRANQISNQGIKDRISSTLAQRGTDYATALGQLRAGERNFAVAQAGVNLKQDTLANAQRNTTNLINTRTQNANTAAQNAGTAAQRAKDAALLAKYNTNPNYVGSPAWARVQSSQGSQWSSDPNAIGSPAWARVQTALNRNNKNGAGPKPLTTTANNQYFRQLGQVEALVNSMQQPLNKAAAAKLNLPAGTKLSKQQISNLLTAGNNPAGKSFDQVMVQAAYELLGWGHLTPQTAAALHQQGVRGGNFRNAPIKVAPAPVSKPPTDTTGGVPAGIQNPLGSTL